MKTILFDLDGTLLPMDQEVFTRAYLQELGHKGTSLGYGEQELIRAVLGGLEIMMKNDGEKTNEERFWTFFLATFGGDVDKHSQEFDKFYQNEFSRVAKAVQPTPLAKQAITILKQKGYELVLATNPVFPRAATRERMRWAGLEVNDFALITTYENSRFTKPSLKYYQEILTTIGARAEDCLMIGNDVLEDLVVAELGMEVFLVTDDLINTEDLDYSQIPQGNRHEMLDFLQSLPTVERVLLD